MNIETVRYFRNCMSESCFMYLPMHLAYLSIFFRRFEHLFCLLRCFFGQDGTGWIVLNSNLPALKLEDYSSSLQ